MTPSARIAAAIEVMADIDARRRPAGDALKDWGLSHRFAGSGDRSAIAGLVYDALRRRSSAAHLIGEETPRAIVLGMLKLERAYDADAVAALFSGARFAPEPLTDAETDKLKRGTLSGAPPHIAGDYPEWLDPYFMRSFGEARVEEATALARRAPLDLRVNTLKAERDAVLRELAHLNATPTRWSPIGVRIALSFTAKNPAVHAEPAYIKGAVEVQDEGSQIAALLTGARAGETVIDLCAGAGGKTLALAALLQRSGKIYATDLDKRRLAPIHERLARAGADNVEVRTPKGFEDTTPVADLAGLADLVLIDAPCTGTGTWRRNPDAKWRMRPGALEQRIKEQIEVLDRAAGLVRPGGRIAYVTCSVLADENEDQVQAFIGRHPEFGELAPDLSVLGARADEFRTATPTTGAGLLMTPRRTATDGFFVSLLQRNT
jgi:16S rRNA (cytosine967-C5)-methyltransferase